MDSRTDLSRYEALLSATPQVVWRMTAEGKTSVLVGHLGDVGAGLWHPREPGESWPDAVHPRDRAEFATRWAETARGNALFDAVVRIRQSGDGIRYRHVRIIAVPLMEGSTVGEWIGTVTDAQDQWRVRTRDRLTERVSAVSATKDLPEVFAATAAAVVPDLVDAFAVFQLRHPQAIDSAGLDLHATRARTALAEGVPPLPPITDGFTLGALAQTVIDTQHPKTLTFPPGEPPRTLVSAASATWMTHARATSLTIIPVVVDGRTVALASAASCLGNPPPGDAEMGLLEEVLRSLQDPLRRTLELQSVRNTALVLQRSFLITPPQVDGADIVAVYQPASSTAEIGGDWYDAVLLPDGALALSIGDVAGHDLHAATEMTRISSMLRAFAYTAGQAGPAHTLTQLDQVTQGTSDVPLITVLHLVLRRAEGNGWDVTWSNAGHPPPLLIPAAGPARHLVGAGTPDPPLSVSCGVERHAWHVELHEGDVLVLYTDGLIERPDTDIAERMRHLAGHAEALHKNGRPLAECVAELLPPTTEARDDIAVVAFRAAPRSAPPPPHRQTGPSSA
ncbi:SpoIIE family protein phosphatase [Streptomyces californicus]|uniref:SpoIIE family protein phosphatase n=1 Tax=Streptomyces californicus TaxID=67351 RepID=UPI003713D2A8